MSSKLWHGLSVSFFKVLVNLSVCLHLWLHQSDDQTIGISCAARAKTVIYIYTYMNRLIHIQPASPGLRLIPYFLWYVNRYKAEELEWHSIYNRRTAFEG